jgi:hypothetical protein
MGSINNISSSYLQSVLNSVLQKDNATASTTGNSLSGIGASSLLQQADNQQISPFAELMSTLQQLQQSNPTKYQQVTAQVATNLASAAQTATSEGNTTAASQLTQLSTDFTNASKTGQLPNIQDLAEAVSGGHHHHHHHHHAAAGSSSSSSSTDNSSSTSSSSSTSQSLSQFLAALQASGTQNDSLNPMAIILNTLSNAGITGSTT